mgnify:CR=1 FL=1
MSSVFKVLKEAFQESLTNPFAFLIYFLLIYIFIYYPYKLITDPSEPEYSSFDDCLFEETRRAETINGAELTNDERSWIASVCDSNGY